MPSHTLLPDTVAGSNLGKVKINSDHIRDMSGIPDSKAMDDRKNKDISQELSQIIKDSGNEEWDRINAIIDDHGEYLRDPELEALEATGDLMQRGMKQLNVK